MEEGCMDKLRRLIDLCGRNLIIETNPHRSDWVSVEQGIEHLEDCYGIFLSYEVKKGIIESDVLIKIYCSPSAFKDSFIIIHYDIEVALDLALEYFDNEV